eukprot:TRINITY_DN28040_c2_g1_i1.p1 TRINITY_DN28040_c2_g1~~TRINITY_DN28040_c2_g1_i1.p1  ORF type:complete len:641 (-),score=113.63 TRINITY_DN28040_c2_g1_i1:18-1817(-)
MRDQKRKKIKDKNNKQIRGKGGLGKKRAAGRKQKADVKSASYFVKVYPKGQDPEEKKQQQVSYVKLAKEQEEKAAANDGKPQEPEGDAPSFERSHLPTDGVRKKTVDVDAEAASGAAGPSSQTAAALRTGCAVYLVGLQGAADLNGKLGKCVRWDAEKQRWLVSLPGGEQKLLKPENLKVKVEVAQQHQPKSGLAPGATVRIHGLQTAPDLNGKHGTLDSWDPAKRRFKVRLTTGEEKLLKPENLKAVRQKELQAGTSVKLVGLQSAPELNGKIGTCVHKDSQKGRWLVRLDGGLEKFLKAENLSILMSEEQPKISHVVRQVVEVLPSSDKLDKLSSFVVKVRLEEKKGKRARSLMLVLCNCPRSLEQLSESLNYKQIPHAVLHPDHSEVKRQNNVHDFCLENKRLMVALGNKGADFADVALDSLGYLIHYDFPHSLSAYSSRLSKLGRSGTESTALTLLDESQKGKGRTIQASTAAGLVSMLESAGAVVPSQLKAWSQEQDGATAGPNVTVKHGAKLSKAARKKRNKEAAKASSDAPGPAGDTEDPPADAGAEALEHDETAGAAAASDSNAAQQGGAPRPSKRRKRGAAGKAAKTDAT